MQDKPLRRKAVNLTFNAQLIAAARAANLSPSATLETAQHRKLAAQRWDASTPLPWLDPVSDLMVILQR